jgi:hypothetical protein
VFKRERTRRHTGRSLTHFRQFIHANGHALTPRHSAETVSVLPRESRGFAVCGSFFKAGVRTVSPFHFCACDGVIEFERPFVALFAKGPALDHQRAIPQHTPRRTQRHSLLRSVEVRAHRHMRTAATHRHTRGVWACARTVELTSLGRRVSQ